MATPKRREKTAPVSTLIVIKMKKEMSVRRKKRIGGEVISLLARERKVEEARDLFARAC
jgi:heme exporter protein D